MLKIKLFGTGQAFFVNQPLDGFPHRQPHLLLCYLLLNGQYSNHREQLAAVFWRDASTHTARKRLRTTLWSLKKLFEEAGTSLDTYFAVDEDSITFLKASQYWLDVEIFDETIKVCQHLSTEELTADFIQKLETAAALYQGDLLENLYEDWLLSDREQRRLCYLRILDKLLAYYAANDNYDRSIIYGERMLACDSTREKVHRQLMRLYCLAGDRHVALAQYEQCRETLDKELGVRPMVETQILYDQIRYGKLNLEAGWNDREEPGARARRLPETNHQLTRHVLQKLQQLRELNAVCSAELQRLEHLIGSALTQDN